MITSKIKSIESVKPFDTRNGTILYHNLTMDNGDKINIGKTKEQQVGYELSYKITGVEGQREYTKATPVAPEPKTEASSKDKLILRQVAFKAAIELVANGKANLDEVEEFTNEFNEILLNTI